MKNSVVLARRVTKADFDAATSCLACAEAASIHVIDKAHSTADKVYTELQELISQHEIVLQDTKSAKLKQAIDDATARRKSEAAVALIDAAALIRAEFDKLTPWLCDLLGLSLRKILGQGERSELVALSLEEAVKDLNARAALVLRVNAKDFWAVKEFVETYPNRFLAIEDVRLDWSLRSGEVFLETEGCFLELSLDAQVEALMKQLRRGMVDNCEEHSNA